jgi:hypothetical protein
MTYLHIHLGNRIILEIFIITVIQYVVIIKGHALWPQHVGQKRELFLFKTLM